MVGLAVTVGGLLLVPLPGPGWLIVFVGLAILASEFAWAQHLLDFARARFREWTRWLKGQEPWVRALVGFMTAAFVAGVMYLIAFLRGVPGWVPEGLVPPLPGL
jgi:Putative transmembrane protein (PGPGW).